MAANFGSYLNRFCSMNNRLSAADLLLGRTVLASFHTSTNFIPIVLNSYGFLQYRNGLLFLFTPHRSLFSVGWFCGPEQLHLAIKTDLFFLGSHKINVFIYLVYADCCVWQLSYHTPPKRRLDRDWTLTTLLWCTDVQCFMDFCDILTYQHGDQA